MLNILDIVLVVLALAIVVSGYRKGFIWQAARWIGWIVSLVVAFMLAGELAELMHAVIPFTWTPQGDAAFWWNLLNPDGLLYLLLAFILLFFMCKLVITIIAAILNGIAKFPGLNLLNRLLGAVLGVVQALLLTFILVHVLLWVPWEAGNESVRASELALLLLQQSPFYP